MRSPSLALLGLLAAAPALAQPAPPWPLLRQGPQAEAVRGIEASQQLPGGSFAAVKVTGRDGLYFLSGDGRILIKGTAFDLWNGRALASLEEVRRAAGSLDLAGFSSIWPQLDPLPLGGGAVSVVAFVAPGCPHCQELIDQARGLADRYRFLFLPIPAGGDSGAVVRTLACAEDRPAAAAAYLRHALDAATPQDPGCNLEAVQRRVITARMLGVKSVPWIVRGDGRLSGGLPADLAGWLAAGGTR